MTTTPSQARTKAELEAQIVAKAWQDENFKQELLSNPKAVLEREMGQKSPADFELTVVEETSNHMYIVLPMKPSNIKDSQELSEEALETVAGGLNLVKNGWLFNT
jgi:hypothetical protein